MRNGTFWMRIICLAWLSNAAAFSQSTTTDPGEGKLVPSTPTDKPMNTHIWVGGPPSGSFSGLPPMGRTETVISPSFFVGKYAGGDWDANSRVDKGLITGGGLQNLSDYIQYVSRKKIPESLSATPLDLSTEQVLAMVKIPFLFLTGTKDFVFTDQEVEELRKYLRAGGCLWVDNGSPDPSSPFDRAFRREIRRLMPTNEPMLKPLPMTHPLFSRSWNEIKELPPASNGLTSPLEQIEMEGTMAVLYMPNDYVTLWAKPWSRERQDAGHASPAHQLGMNCFIYLLTRWDERSLFPEGIPPVGR